MKFIDEKQILFEDNHLLIVNKPANLLTQPTNLECDSIEIRAKAYIKSKYNKPGNVFLHAAHRLDKPVSGIVVFAKTTKALKRLNEQIRQGSWQKIYHATLDNPIQSNRGEFIDYLLHKDYHAKIVAKNTPGAKKAHLHYKKREDNQVEIRLITGRYHQIRAQFAHRGHPIRGDRKYGAKKHTPFINTIALKHYSLTFFHPCSNKTLKINL